MGVEDSTDKLRTIKRCPFCNSRYIEFKRKIGQLSDTGFDTMTVYCYCTNCGFKNQPFTSRFRDMDEARDMAYTLWNQRAEQ